MIPSYPLGIDLSKIAELYPMNPLLPPQDRWSIPVRIHYKRSSNVYHFSQVYRLKMKLISCLIFGIFLGTSCDLLGWNRSQNFVHAIELSGRKFQPKGYQERLQRHQLEAIVRFYQRHNPDALKSFVAKIRSSIKHWATTNDMFN